MEVDLTYGPYVFLLDPRLYLGATYILNKNYNANLLLYNRFLPCKIQTAATVSLTCRSSEKSGNQYQLVIYEPQFGKSGDWHGIWQVPGSDLPGK